jgi:kynureninase
MVTIEPPVLENPILTTEYILSIIALHATTASILLLPGIQFYTGQLFDIQTITEAARAAGIFVIWYVLSNLLFSIF